jgi:hypothetical protein
VRIVFDDGHDTGLDSWDLICDLGASEEEAEVYRETPAQRALRMGPRLSYSKSIVEQIGGSPLTQIQPSPSRRRVAVFVDNRCVRDHSR